MPAARPVVFLGEEATQLRRDAKHAREVRGHDLGFHTLGGAGMREIELIGAYAARSVKLELCARQSPKSGMPTRIPRDVSAGPFSRTNTSRPGS